MAFKSDLAQKLDQLFHPRSIAVVGASGTPNSFGYLFMDYLLKAGYGGDLYPVNPRGGAIMGITSYPSLKDIPGDVDYVISCIGAGLVPDMIRQCPGKKVKAVHLFTGRLSETGDAGAHELEHEIASLAKKLGVSLIGPNCMGLYYPRERISYAYGLPVKPGPVGGIFQSGGASITFCRLAGLRGVCFSKVVSYGNAVDINECDLLEYLTEDEETRLIVIYIEGVRDGRRFFKTLRRATAVKPVVVLKGGKTGAGTRSTVSHTASIAGSLNTWEVMFGQCNAVQAADMDEFVDLTTAFYFLPEITGKRVGVIGGSGGKVVLSADECEQAGLEVVAMPGDVREFIGERAPQLAGWMGNPVDFSILGGTSILPGELLRRMAESPGFDFIMCNMTEENPFEDRAWAGVLEHEAGEYMNIAGRGTKPMVVTIVNPELGFGQVGDWRWKTLLKQREILVENGIPVFSSVRRAATAVSKMVDYYRKRSDTEA
ncbi:MAG: acetate--CoA ligase family protein [Bacillota bacterium]